MGDFHDIVFSFCSKNTARKVCKAMHYMKTYPAGAKIDIAMVDRKKVVGICVFGYSSATDAKARRVLYDVPKSQYIEMQRLWISDDYGKNTESFCLSKIIRLLADTYKIRVILTHAGGCKNDCGIVYQSSGWLYFGASSCDDFYLTRNGEYKSIVAALRFGRVSQKGKTKEQIGYELFGERHVINAKRHFYVYPIDKAIRRRLTKIALPFPKDSSMFRKDQKWVTT